MHDVGGVILTFGQRMEVWVASTTCKILPKSKIWKQGGIPFDFPQKKTELLEHPQWCLGQP